ncbi:BTB/POZ domain-containing protein 17 [Drosophila sulfurigaster albostrigata]|uniref:BTB/POZ domain-containing protein 17 n=1 Tax=Drosophila sulfurigaster albostrigata TaxID=89887 RepID=UPI002D21BADE|nr:BTB/POZ domain-containing protein 17 [Drosophila sulfurigaster albostrigata]
MNANINGGAAASGAGAGAVGGGGGGSGAGGGGAAAAGGGAAGAAAAAAAAGGAVAAAGASAGAAGAGAAAPAVGVVAAGDAANCASGNNNANPVAATNGGSEGTTTPLNEDQDAKRRKCLETDEAQDGASTMIDANSVLNKIAHLYADKLMSDIVLLVDGNEYPAHRVILCASSDVFQVMLMNPEWNECSKRVIELHEEACCSAVFPQFIKYLYVGHIEVALQTVMPMLALSDKYNVRDLIELCVGYMMKHVAKAATSGYLVSWLQYTLSFTPTHNDLTETLKRFLKWNLGMVAESKDFVDMDPAILQLLLQQNDIVVASEYKLFNILQTWLLHRHDLIEATSNLSAEKKASSFVELIEQTVMHIRFGMMTPTELSKLMCVPLIKYHNKFLVERIAIGMSYQSGQEDRVREVRYSECGELQFTPRLYWNDTWSVGIDVPNFDEIEDYKNYVTCFFSQRHIAETEDDPCMTWEIEFFPRGVKYNKAKMVCGEDVPGCSLNTVRLRVTCKHNNIEEERFKIAVLIVGVQNQIPHIRTVVERTEYFSDEARVINLDNLLPYEELEHTSPYLSPHLTGNQRNTLSLHVVITPMDAHTCRDTPPFQF